MSAEYEVDTLDLSEMKNDVERLANQGQGNQANGFLDNFVQMPEKEGYVNIRLLPPRKGAKFYQATKTHKINGKTFHCRKEFQNGKWVGNDCPICNYIRELYNLAKKEAERGNLDAEESYKAEAKSLLAYERYYYNAIVRNKDGKDVGPKIFSCGKEVHGLILRGIFGDPSADIAGLGNIADLKAGRDFKVIKKMVKSDGGVFARYTTSNFDQSLSAVGEDEQIKTYISNMFDLSELRSPKAADELEKQIAIHRGLIKDDSSSFDIDALDAKYGKKETVESVVTSVEESTPVSSTSSDSDEDLSIDEESFMKDLVDIQNQLT